jgi:hypothetical protein
MARRIGGLLAHRRIWSADSKVRVFPCFEGGAVFKLLHCNKNPF